MAKLKLLNLIEFVIEALTEIDLVFGWICNQITSSIHNIEVDIACKYIQVHINLIIFV